MFDALLTGVKMLILQIPAIIGISLCSVFAKMFDVIAFLVKKISGGGVSPTQSPK